MIAIIPARGGSKGLPRKNIKILHGKPMIAYAIEEAFKSKYISEVIISTDSDEIAEIAIKLGASCPFMRPNTIASDESRAIDVYKYTIDRLSEMRREQIDEFVVLQPTSPLRTVDDIDGAIKLFIENRADSVISYSEEQHPIRWHKYITSDLKFNNIFNDTIENRQKNQPSYYPNGAVYVFRSSLLSTDTYYSDSSYAYIMPRSRSVDIDTIDDFLYA